MSAIAVGPEAHRLLVLRGGALTLLSIWPLTFSFPVVPPPPPGGPPDEAESKLDNLCSSCDDFEFFSLDTENIPVKYQKETNKSKLNSFHDRFIVES